jgi:hypothetical protein
MPDAAAYRAKAQEMLRRAGATHDPVAYQELMNLAAEYETLARQVEGFAVEDKHRKRSKPSD